MECKHIYKSINISPSFLEKKSWFSKNEKISCSECDSNSSPWMCLKCGEVFCGRYVNAHCKQHCERNINHDVCIDLSLAVFCYKCDDFVINDTNTNALKTMRETMTKCSLADEEDCKKEKKTSNAEYFDKSPRTNVSNPKTVVGLRNLGNTCFMNAVLQALANLIEFTSYFKKASPFRPLQAGSRVKTTLSRYKEENLELVEELRKVLCNLWKGSPNPVSPDSFFAVVCKMIPSFRGFQQQDAHEFLLYLLNNAHTELLKGTPCIDKKTIVTETLGGLLQSEVTCLKCKRMSKKKEDFLDLSLDLPTTKNDRSDICCLTECLQNFIKVEELEKNEWYLCEHCKRREPTTKRFWLLQLPNVICIHLKRFRYNHYNYTKVNTFVRFPIKDLDMNPYLLENPLQGPVETNIYDLSGVVVHHGSGSRSGHYTSYSKRDGEWYDFNDGNVLRTNEEVIVRTTGYVLFYTRKDPDLIVF